MMLAAGQCIECGCTDERACPGGCIWANVTATLCSRCALGRVAVGPSGQGGWLDDDTWASITPDQLAERVHGGGP